MDAAASIMLRMSSSFNDDLDDIKDPLEDCEWDCENDLPDLADDDGDCDGDIGLLVGEIGGSSGRFVCDCLRVDPPRDDRVPRDEGVVIVALCGLFCLGVA